MKTTFYLKNTLKLAFMAGALFLSSCTEDNTLIETTEEEEEEIDYTITVNATNGSTTERTLDITAVEGTTVPVIVKFTKEDDSMDRLYVIQTLSGSTEGSVAYDIDPDDLYDLDTKLDGSLDLEGDQEDEFSFTINFPAPANDNATVQYVLWVTEGRGDYRDITNDNSFEDETTHAVITITAGTAAELSGIKEFTETILAAPLDDGNSETFTSIFNGEKYKIVQQDNKTINSTYTTSEKEENAELSALWDFGYFYGNTAKASFASAAKYMEAFTNNSGPVVNITNFTGLDKEDLNNCYFKKSSLTDFDGVTKENLENIIKSDTESINQLAENEIIEFVDQYGNKGIIQITEINGTWNKDDYITFNVKVLINATPINL